MAGGVRRLVEFGDRNINGASSFITSDPKVAQAIRRHSMSRRGIIIETTPSQKEEPVVEEAKPQPRTLGVVKGIVKPAAPQTRKPAGKKADAKKFQPQQKPAGKVRAYANFSVAKSAISKEFGIPKTKIKTASALDKFAFENGFSIKYTEK